MLYGLINFGTFLTGAIFGILISGIALFHVLVSTKPSNADKDLPKEINADSAKDSELPIGLTQEDVDRLNSIIEYLDEVGSPLKSMGVILQKVHANKDVETSSIDVKMKTIVDLVTLTKLEKEHQDNITELKDHAKQIKLLSSFLNDTSRAVSSFSKDLNKLASAAKSNMHRNSVIETKEDMIVNAWWQSLQISMDHLASDQEELAVMVSDQLQNVSQQLQEEISLIEKRLNSEGNRYFSALRENIQLFEARLRDRDKCKDKIRTASITGAAASLLTSASEQHQKRQLKLKQAEEALVTQTRRLYEAQRDFYMLIPRIASDVQLTVLKSIIETQSQLMKLADGIERAQGNSRNVCRRLRSQLTNAAGSLVQMINSESKLLPDSSSSFASDSGEATAIIGSTSMALEIMRQRQQDRYRERGVKGYELSLQRVLEGLLLQAQAKREPLTKDSTAKEITNGLEAEDETAKLDMFAETTACLAANNPTCLPDLPRQFSSHAIGLETCVWFNAFCGRVYRDMAESAYFNAWFRAKLATMLNKGKRPGYVDAFEITSVKFGDQPPLLLNVKWFPPPTKRKRRTATGNASAGTGGAASTKNGNSHTLNNEENDSDDSDTEGNTTNKLNEENEGENEGENDADPTAPSDNNDYDDDDVHYYAACNADICFRSGIQFTVATRFWLNWPRDRYASVPIFIHLDLSELQGRVRFGVKRSHSFLSFLKDPLTRISVRSEVGSDRLKLRDIPQVSDFIVRKLKSFIHRKIVHPHSHKFRLIWPRNWWPSGTENLFTSTTTVNVPGVSDSGAAVPAGGAAAATAGTSVKKEGNEIAVQTDIMAVGMTDVEVDDMMRETLGPSSYTQFGLASVTTTAVSVASSSSRRPSFAPPLSVTNANSNNTSSSSTSPSQKAPVTSTVAAVATSSTIVTSNVSVDNDLTISRRTERTRSMSNANVAPYNSSNAAADALSSTSDSKAHVVPAAVSNSEAASLAPSTTASATVTPVKGAQQPALSNAAALVQHTQQQQEEYQWRGHLRRVSERLQQQQQQIHNHGSTNHSVVSQSSEASDDPFTHRLAETISENPTDHDHDEVEENARRTSVQQDIADALRGSPIMLTSSSTSQQHANSANDNQHHASSTSTQQNHHQNILPWDDRVVSLHMRHWYRKYQDQRQPHSPMHFPDSKTHSKASGNRSTSANATQSTSTAQDIAEHTSNIYMDSMEESSTDCAGYALFHHQTILHPQRRPRAMSISDFRSEVMTVLLEDVLDHKDLKIPGSEDYASGSAAGHGREDLHHMSPSGHVGNNDDDADANRGKLLVGFRRARRVPTTGNSHGAETGTRSTSKAMARRQTSVPTSRNTPGNANTERGRKRTSTLSGMEYGYIPQFDRSYSAQQNAGNISTTRRGIQQQGREEDEEDTNASDLDAAKKWLKTRGKEGMEKAKAKFREFASKHFSGSDTQQQTTSSHGGSASASASSDTGPNSSTTTAAGTISSSAPVASSPGAHTGGLLTKIERRLSGRDMSLSISGGATSAGSSSHTIGGAASEPHHSSMKSLVTSIFRDRDRDSSHGQGHSDESTNNTSSSGSAGGSGLNSMFSKAFSHVRQHIQEARSNNTNNSNQTDNNP